VYNISHILHLIRKCRRAIPYKDAVTTSYTTGRKYDCLKTLLMSDKTLAKALNKNVPYNGLYFKEIGSKLKCV
jgi:hypothetical protein